VRIAKQKEQPRGLEIASLVSRVSGRRKKAPGTLRSFGQAVGGRCRFIAIVFFCVIALGNATHAQDGGRPVSREHAPSDRYRSPESSDLVKENLERVAASAVQVKAVLIKDPGLLVELKRWVAKEAGDNGQVVEDSAVSDQGIYERLEQDLAFRSVATRLVQRYGYLLPSVNPDSDAAK
jgi:hypothetical protein